MSSTEVSTGIVGGGVLSGETQSADVAGNIADLSERLHRARLSQRLLVLWAAPGNAALVAAGTGCFLLPDGAAWWLLVLAVLVPVASVIGSGILLHRQYFRVRSMRATLRELRRMQREQLLDDYGLGDLPIAHKRYRAQLPDAVIDLRAQAGRHRRKHNMLQSVIIFGSIVASVVSALSVSLAAARWYAVGISLLVAVTAAFAGYGKYRERGENLQQTADALEREYHSVELRVGKYRRFSDEPSAYAEFAHQVEALFDEHAKRQQQLGSSFTHDAML